MNIEMNNPWNISEAFNPMYIDRVVISGRRKTDGGVRNITCVLNAMVIESGLEMTDTEIATDVYAWSVIMPAENWKDTSKPQIGDEVTFVNECTANYKVARVSLQDGIYTLYCRGH